MAEGAVLLVGAGDDVAGLCRTVAEAAGVALAETDRPPDGAAWERAPLVLLGPRVEHVPRGRPGLVVVDVPGPDPGAGGAVLDRCARLGAEHVALLPDAGPWLGRRMARAVEEAGPRGRVVGVVGGCGGAGASVLVAALATTAAAHGIATVVLDADPVGGGVDLLLAAEDEPGLRWADLADVRGPLQPGLLAGLLPRVRSGADGPVSVLTWDRTAPVRPGAGPPGDLSQAVADAVVASARAAAGLVLVDLPRVVPAAGGVRRLAAACDVVLLVVPAHVRAAAAAVAVLAGVEAVAADVRVVVRRTAGGLAPSAICDSLAVPLAAVLRTEPGLAAALDRGEPPALRPRGPLRRACGPLLAELLRPVPGRPGERADDPVGAGWGP